MKQIMSALAVSDLHLGKESSYLHVRHPAYPSNRETVSRFLDAQGKRDELIIAGDLLELALGSLDQVFEDVRAFFALLADLNLYRRIVYIPGNHDHHFWWALVEDVLIQTKQTRGESPPNHEQYPHCFVDQRFSNLDPQRPCRALTALWPGGKSPELVVKYPHHLFSVTTSAGSAHYLCTHGHFLEDLFKPANFLYHPSHLEELEAFNIFWLEAFNYHVGHAGRLSREVNRFLGEYEKGKPEMRRMIKRLALDILERIQGRIGLNWLGRILCRGGISFLIHLIRRPGPSHLRNTPLTDGLRKQIADYISDYLIQRYRPDRQVTLQLPTNKEIPRPFTFVFGHTHRPIRDEDEHGAAIHLNGLTYPLANTGGWLRTDGDGRGANAGALLIGDRGYQWESLEGRLV